MKAPAVTGIDGLVLALLLPSVLSVAVRVALPAVLSVTLKTFVPATKAALAGRAALRSDEVIATVSVTLVSGFQLASTALTVTLKAVPAVCAIGVPVLPVGVPGALVSPGTSNCNFANAPELTVMDALVLEVLDPSVMLVAVAVALPTVLSVMLKLLVPETRAALMGRLALVSEELMLTVSVTFVTRFQKASTAFAVALNG